MAMLMKKNGQTCLLVVGMGSVALLMMVLYGTYSSRLFGSHGLRRAHQPLGSPMYKLDPGWPRKPELFNGDVFAVAVHHSAGVVYVAQRGEYHL